eukprot:scaffold69176_cov60-Phaeocystis_antarctica.AAC.2
MSCRLIMACVGAYDRSDVSTCAGPAPERRAEWPVGRRPRGQRRPGRRWQQPATAVGCRTGRQGRVACALGHQAAHERGLRPSREKSANTPKPEVARYFLAPPLLPEWEGTSVPP